MLSSRHLIQAIESGSLILIRDMDEYWNCMKVLHNHGYTWASGHSLLVPQYYTVVYAEGLLLAGNTIYIRTGGIYCRNNGITIGVYDASAMFSPRPVVYYSDEHNKSFRY